MSTETQELSIDELMDSLDLHYKTSDLNFFQKLLQMYWMNPKSWLLDELTIKCGNVEVILKNGDRFQAPLSELQVKHQKDDYDRTELYLSYDEDKIHFKEIPGMLTKEQWKELLDVLYSVKNAKESTLGKITKVGRKVLDVADGLTD